MPPPQLHLGKAATITGTSVVFKGAITSTSTPSVPADLTNKLYVDNTVLTQTNRIDTILSGAAIDMDTLVELTNFFTALSGEETAAIVNLTTSVSNETSRAIAAESGISSNLASEVARATAAEVACNDYTDAEVATELVRALAAETAISTALGTEISSRISSESGLASDIASEATTARAAEAAELARAEAAELVLTNALASEVTRAEAAEAAELARAEAAELVLTNALADEVARAEAAEATELARAEAAELVLTNALADEVARAEAAELVLTNALASEASTARAAEAAELARAEAAELVLTNALASEASTARAAEARLVTLLNYTKPLSQEAAIHNSVGTVVGDLPTSMPEAIFTAGYDGWYFTNTNVSPAFNYVNWKFNSNFPNVAFSDVNSVSVNMQVLSVASVPVLTVFTKPTGLDTNYHQKITYSLSSPALAALTVNNLYTFYAISAPPQIPNHAQVQLSVVSISGPALAGDEMVLDFNLLSDVAQSSGNVSFIASQLSIGSTNGNENWSLSNDSIRANQTRARLDAIYYYFFNTDSSVDPDPEDPYPST